MHVNIYAHQDASDLTVPSGTPQAIGDHEMEGLLLDNNLLRLWRTGAGEEIYCAEEDGPNVDVSYNLLTPCYK
jgi:hypothetical protein